MYWRTPLTCSRLNAKPVLLGNDQFSSDHTEENTDGPFESSKGGD